MAEALLERSMLATPVAASKPQANYAITIVASGASGGGFKDFGVFRDEASYTVYLDMADAGAHGSTWTLQYALDSDHVRRPPFRLHVPTVSLYLRTRHRNHFRAFLLKQRREAAAARL